MNIKQYIKKLPAERQPVIAKLRKVVVDNLPTGFAESVTNMLNYSIPLSIYPDGYHCTDKTPLPFANIASQKNFVALYHMGLYADKELLNWFGEQYPKHCKYKLNMGKSCIRFKYLNDIPYELIAELMRKITVADFIQIYESAIKR